MQVYFSLGSNLGSRRANIEKALNLMSEAFGKPFEKLSDLIETRSWGFDGPDFLDAAVCYDLDINPEDAEKEGLRILGICKGIERDLGRVCEAEFDGSGQRIYKSRPIDIDILLMGDCRIDHPLLKVPHPLMTRRDFVMLPLGQIRELPVCD